MPKPMPAPENPVRRPIRSFVRRAGRLTTAQRRALRELWPEYGIDCSRTKLDLASCFGNANPVTLEIGFGDGELLVNNAALHPEANYLGIEVHEPGIGHCLLAIHAAKLRNVRLIKQDALEVLNHQIGADTLSGVDLFFPDPWRKKRHHKRRIVQPAFVRLVASRLRSGGLLHIATDWENYAEQIRHVVAAEQVFMRLDEQRGERPTTKFETRGERLGHTIFDLRYRKK